jgi:hypothetical protein
MTDMTYPAGEDAMRDGRRPNHLQRAFGCRSPITWRIRLFRLDLKAQKTQRFGHTPVHRRAVFRLNGAVEF